jgi:hypothetical protein
MFKEAHFLDHRSAITADHGGLERVEDLFELRASPPRCAPRLGALRPAGSGAGSGRFSRRRRSAGLHRRRIRQARPAAPAANRPPAAGRESVSHPAHARTPSKQGARW